MNYNNVLLPSDVTGTGVWRLLWPEQAISRDRDIDTTIFKKIVVDPNYYANVNMIMCQRLISNYQRNILQNVLVPAAKRFGIWIVPNLDDCLHPDEIPEYNQGRAAYMNPEVVDNIRYMLHASDFIIVSTDEIKDYYNKKYDVPLEKLIKIPNYLPDWEFGNKYNETEVLEIASIYKKRPRIGIISSTSHYNQNADSPVKDDLDLILNLIRTTTDKYNWVFLGSLPHKVAPLLKEGKIEFHKGVDIYNYPNALKNLKLNCMVAPLIDNTFNRCKSNIKILEASAIGIPFFVQDLPNYSRYTKYTFKDEEDLRDKLKNFFNLSKYQIRDITKNNLKFLSTPCQEGNGWWMSSNLHMWEAIFKLRKNTCKINVKEYAKFMAQQQQAQIQTMSQSIQEG